jgi:thymidine kinase
LFQSFESNAGYSSALTDLDMRYSLSAQLNNTHYVSNVSHPVLDEEGGNFIVKSLPYKFDLFDYSKDILRIPDKLTALQAFRGRLWAFTDSKIFIIEPNNMYIEDTMVGIGCAHQRSNVVTWIKVIYICMTVIP